MVSMEYLSGRAAGVEHQSAAVGVSGCSSAGAVRVGCGVPECGDCEWCRE